MQQLYQHVGELRLANHQEAAQGIAAYYHNMEPDTIASLNNQVLLIITEYHLMSLNQGSSCICPVLPEVVEDLLPSLEEYLLGDFKGSRDVRVTDQANILRISVWLHHLDTAAPSDLQLGDISYHPNLHWPTSGRHSVQVPP